MKRYKVYKYNKRSSLDRLYVTSIEGRTKEDALNRLDELMQTQPDYPSITIRRSATEPKLSWYEVRGI